MPPFGRSIVQIGTEGGGSASAYRRPATKMFRSPRSCRNLEKRAEWLHSQRVQELRDQCSCIWRQAALSISDKRRGNGVFWTFVVS